MALALLIGALVAGAVYLLLQRDFVRMILGFVLASHAVNLLLFCSGGTDRRTEPLGSDLDPAVTADALPQAFVLTAIVIAFGITIYMLALAVTGASFSGPATGDTEMDDDPDPGASDAEAGTTGTETTQ